MPAGMDIIATPMSKGARTKKIITLVSQRSEIGRRDHKVETFIVAKNIIPT